jgi:hypothetical protein
MSAFQKSRTTSASLFQSYREMGEILLRRPAPRVLVVDDNPDTMVLMRELLSTLRPRFAANPRT